MVRSEVSGKGGGRGVMKVEGRQGEGLARKHSARSARQLIVQSTGRRWGVGRRGEHLAAGRAWGGSEFQDSSERHPVCITRFDTRSAAPSPLKHFMATV